MNRKERQASDVKPRSEFFERVQAARDRVLKKLRDRDAAKIVELYLVGEAFNKECRALSKRKGKRRSVRPSLLSAFGKDRNKVDRGSRLARTWTLEEIEKLCERRTCRGDVISASHLMVVASCPAERREHWLDVCFEEGLTVEELKEAAAEERMRRRKRSQRDASVGGFLRLVERLDGEILHVHDQIRRHLDGTKTFEAGSRAERKLIAAGNRLLRLLARVDVALLREFANSLEDDRQGNVEIPSQSKLQRLRRQAEETGFEMAA